MSDEGTSAKRTVFCAILVGVVVGVVTAKLMDGWPAVKADGEKLAGSRQFFDAQAETFRHAANQIAPAVVNIVTIEKVRMVVGDVDDLFGFRPFYRNRKIQEGRRIRGIGSGFVFDAARGYILTNNHVVEGGEEWTIKLADKRELSAKLIGADAQTDLAVLQIEAPNLAAATLGDSDRVERGDWVLATGNPFGMLEQTVTAGIISYKGRHGLGLSNYEDYIQTDAAINQGNSGGPLVDLNGHVVGINSAIYSRSGGYQGIAFAIPINQARRIAQRLIAHGEIVRGWMGVEVRELLPAESKRLGLAAGVGLVVEGIYMRGPAHKAGLEPEDIILQIEGRELHGPNDLRDLVADGEPGTKISVKVLRQGQRKTFDVILAAQPRTIGR